jgi:hypothetical protein
MDILPVAYGSQINADMIAGLSEVFSAAESG